jgi:integrase
MLSTDAVDRRGYRRSPVTLADYRRGCPPPNKGRTFPPEPLTPQEVYALMDACGHASAGRRNRALIMLLWRTGLRCAEALALEPKDVDLQRGEVRVLHGKGDRSRVVALDPAAAAVLEVWARERSALKVGPRRRFFCVISQPTVGAPLHSAYVRELLKELAVKAGIEKRVHPHGLRHTYASWLAEQGTPVHHIRRMLGHGSIAITERYLDHLNPADVLAAMRAVPWPEAPPPSTM